MLLGEKGQLVLRILHITAAASWLGGVLCVFFLVREAPFCGPADLSGMLRASVVIDQHVLVPLGAFGTFFTGLACSLYTQGGFFRCPWTVCKAILTAAMLLAGIFCLFPWAGQELDDACLCGPALYDQPGMEARHVRRELVCAACAALLFACIVLAVLRPGEKRHSQARSSMRLRR